MEEQPLLALDEWKNFWAELLENDAKAYVEWKARWEKSGDPKHKFWMDTFSKRKPWDEHFPTISPIFSPEMLEEWVSVEDD